jgi:DNA-binding transcriptional ArsR family regulator
VQAVLDAIAEPRRRAILEVLRTGEQLVGDLAEDLGIAQPTVSKHLKVMREAGLVAVRQDAQRRWYRLVPDPLVELDHWLAPYRRAWMGRLDDLERHLDEMEDR